MSEFQFSAAADAKLAAVLIVGDVMEAPVGIVTVPVNVGDARGARVYG